MPAGIARPLIFIRQRKPRRLVISSRRIMAWYLAHGDAGRATLRLKRSAHNSERGVKVYYHSVPEIARMFSPGFRLRHRSGIGITVPPTQLEHLARRFPAAAGRLARVDQVLGKLPLFRAMGDCALLEFERM